MEHVGRYAPSPSGDLHLGNARTALLAWLWARNEGGTMLLRIEDLDPDRSRPEVAERQLDDLAALGLDWDGVPVRQSERGALYADALARLAAADLLYPCFCSRADVLAAATAPHGPDGVTYPGTCRELDPHECARQFESGARASLRFRSADGRDDHVLRRSDGVVGYQLAVVVDDADQGITRVLRGADLAPSTPRQLELWHALGLGPPPRYLHVPLVVGEDGRRLGKRDGSLTTRSVLESGSTAEEIVGWLAHSAGLVPTPAPVRPRDLIETFEIAHLVPDPVSIRVSPWASGA
jgi:glutamyl-tRNA synthetase